MYAHILFMGTNNNQAGYDRLFTRPWRPRGHYYGFAKLTTAGSTYVFEVIGFTKKHISKARGEFSFKSVWKKWNLSDPMSSSGEFPLLCYEMAIWSLSTSFSTSTAMREMKRSMPKPNPNAIFRDSANNMQIHWTIQLMYTGIMDIFLALYQ